MADWTKRFLAPVAAFAALLVFLALARLSYALQGIGVLEGVLVVLCFVALRVSLLLLRDNAADGLLRPPVLALLLQLLPNWRGNPASPEPPHPPHNPTDEVGLKREQSGIAAAEGATVAPDAARVAAPRNG